MSSKGWKTYKLGDLCQITSSKRIFAEEYVEYGVPFYRSKEIIQKALGQNITECLFILKSRFLEIKKQSGSPKSGDILLSSVGHRSGIPYLVKEEDGDFYFKDGNLIWFKVFDSRMSSSYLFNWLKSLVGQNLLNSIMIGSAQKALTIVGLSGLDIKLPPYPTQTRIASILSTLDDKIELSRQTNQTLEAIAQAIYKEWFVNSNFPGATGEMQDSELGPIPKGWRVGRVKDLVEIQSGFAFKSDSFADAGKYTIITIKNVQDGMFDNAKTNFIVEIPARMPDYCNLDEGDILLSLTGNVGRVCFLYGQNHLLNQRVAKLCPKDGTNSAYVYTHFRTDAVKNDLMSLGKGTAQQNLSPIETQEMPMVLPPQNILHIFGKLVNPLYERFICNLIEIQYLSETRDSLLPTLISGEIEV